LVHTPYLQYSFYPYTIIDEIKKDFPWYEELHAFWIHHPSINPISVTNAGMHSSEDLAEKVGMLYGSKSNANDDGGEFGGLNMPNDDDGRELDDHAKLALDNDEEEVDNASADVVLDLKLDSEEEDERLTV